MQKGVNSLLLDSGTKLLVDAQGNLSIGEPNERSGKHAGSFRG